MTVDSDSSSSVKVNQFSLKLDAGSIYVQVTKFAGGACDHVWVGDDQGKIGDIALAFNDRTDPKKVTTTKVYGPVIDTAADDVTEGLAAKLSAKLGRPVYFSYGCGSADALFVGAVQKALFEKIKQNPELF